MKPAGWICLLLTATVLAVYSQVVTHEFLYFDDTIDVSHNPFVKKGFTRNSIIWAFTTLEHANWQPLTRLSHLLVTELFGMNAAAGLMVNVLLHLANALLLFFVFREMTGSTLKSGLLAALFALHPLRVESVAWLTERKDVLSGLFWMLTLGAYHRYVQNPGIGRYVTTLLLFVLGLMSKPMVITLPAVLLLLDYWPLGRMSRAGAWKIFKEKAPFFALSICSAVITVIATQRSGALHTITSVGLGERLANIAVSYAAYVRKFFWPGDLAAFYSAPAHLPVWDVVSATVFLVLITVVVLLVAKRPYLSIGWFWFLGTLLPVSGIFNWAYHQMADRFTYIPGIGLCVMVVWGIGEWTGNVTYRRRITAVAAAGVLAALSAVSWFQVGLWKDTITVFSHAVRKVQGNWWAMTALGVARLHAGRIWDSVDVLQRSLAIRSDFPATHLALGKAFQELGRKKLALRHFSQATRLNKNMTAAWVGQGNILLETGQFTEARKCLRRALEIDPESATAHFSMGNLLVIEGRLDEAAAAFRKSLDADPDAYSTHNNLGTVLFRQGKRREAVAHMQQAVRLNPKEAWIRANLETMQSAVGGKEAKLRITR